MKAKVHYLFNFYPKYTRRECVVRIHYSLEPGSWTDVERNLRDVFGDYLADQEPKAAMYTFRGRGGSDVSAIDYFFRDECPRRFEIMAAMIDVLRKEYPEINVRIVRNPISEKDVSLSSSSVWIDDKGYDEAEWAARKRAAGTCDIDAWTAAALDPPDGGDERARQWMSYGYFRLAERLSTRTGRTFAHGPAIARISARMTENNRRRIDGVVDAYIRQTGY